MTKIKIVIASHLSDAQIEITIAPQKAYTRLNFVKMLMIEYPDTEQEVEEEQLNIIWEKVIEIEKR